MIKIEYLPRMSMIFPCDLTLPSGALHRTLSQIRIRGWETSGGDRLTVILRPMDAEHCGRFFPLVPPNGENPSMRFFDGRQLLIEGMSIDYRVEEDNPSVPEDVTIFSNTETYRYNGEIGKDDWSMSAEAGHIPLRVSLWKLGETVEENTLVGDYEGDKPLWRETEEPDLIIDSGCRIKDSDWNDAARGYNTTITLFGHDINPHFIRVDYVGGYGPVCTLSFVPESVLIDARGVIDKRVMVPEESSKTEIILSLCNLGERIPNYIDSTDCTWKESGT